MTDQRLEEKIAALEQAWREFDDELLSMQKFMLSPKDWPAEVAQPTRSIHREVWQQCQEGLKPVPGGLAILTLLVFAGLAIALGFAISPAGGLAAIALCALLVVLAAWAR